MYGADYNGLNNDTRFIFLRPATHAYHEMPWNDREIWKSEKCVEYVWNISQSTFFAFHIYINAQGDGFLMKCYRLIIDFYVKINADTQFSIKISWKWQKVCKGMFHISSFLWNTLK